MDVWIGTSGYSYPDWVGEFYPPRTQSRTMLRYYAQRFPVVELNFTFYRPPTAPVLARIAEQTPGGFQFWVKLPRTISHEEDRRDFPGVRSAVQELVNRGQLAGLLCQFPQSTHYGKSALAWLGVIAEELAGFPIAVEFRHHSWWRDDVNAWLTQQGLIIASVDAPDLPQLYPRGLVQTAPQIYVRLHSRNAGNWYLSDKERYDYHYSDEQLLEWLDALSQTAERTERAWLLFNNCFRAQAVANARRMGQLLAERGPPFTVVGPFASPEPGTTQGTLF